jgi:hypothetical protein
MANQGDVRKVDNEIAKKEEKPPSNFQDIMDAKTRAKEDKTIKSGYAKGGSIRGGGIEQRGKTKGRMV